MVYSYKGTQKFGIALGPRPIVVGAWLTPRNTPLPTSVILPNLVVLYMLTYIVNYSDNAPAI